MKPKKVLKHFANLAVLTGLAVFGSPAVYAGPGEGTLYGTDGDFMNLVTIDINTGLNQTNELTGVNFQALAVHPDGTIFAGTGGSVADIYTVTPAGVVALTFADPWGAAGATAITAMDFGPDPNDNGAIKLFAAIDLNSGNDGDTLAMIDTTSGVATIIGSFIDIDPEFAATDGFQAIAFDRDGKLYGTVVDPIAFDDTRLYTIDPSNGSVTLHSFITDLGSGFPPDGGITGLQFDCGESEILYAGTAFGGLFSPSGGNLGTISNLDSPTFAVYTAIGGPSVLSFEGDLAALAFDATCDGGGPLDVTVVLEASPNATPIRCGQSNRDLVTAVLSSDGSVTPAFDATTINADSVRFGRDDLSPLAAEKHQNGGSATRHEEDVNGDGLTDMVFHFRLGGTDFSCDDIPGGQSSALIPATISGQLAGGEEFEGSGVFEMRN